jgi:hypothetical protein
MSLAASRIIATRALTRRAPVAQQKRGIVDYLTNYPDKVRASIVAPSAYSVAASPSCGTKYITY